MSIKRVLLGVVLAISIFSRTAYAGGFPVIDIAGLTQNLITAVQTVQEVRNSYTSIGHQLQSLRSLDPQTFRQIETLIGDNFQDINDLLANMQGIGFSIGNIAAQYDQLFQADWMNVSPNDYGNFYQRWSDELSSSAKSAMEAQAAVGNTQQINNEVMRILSDSAGADGEVRQLQAQNQMLGALSVQLNGITGALTTAGRVTATAAAADAAEKSLAAEQSDRLRQRYTDMGPPVQAIQTLPAIPN